MSLHPRMFIVFLSLVAVLSACGASAVDGTAVRLASLVDAPAQIREAPPEVRDAYGFALANQELSQAIPCYCGCGAPPHGHRNNADCYIEGKDADGEILYEQHALT